MNKITYDKFIDESVYKGIKDLYSELERISDIVDNLSKKKINIKIDYNGDGKKYKENDQKINDTKKNIDELNLAKKEKERIEKATLLATIKLSGAYDEAEKKLQKLKYAQTEKNKETKKGIQLEEDLINIQEKEIKSIYELEKRNNSLIHLRKNLNLQTKEGVELFEKYTKEISNNQKKLKEYDAQIGNFQRNVGNYSEGIKQGIQNLIGFDFSTLVSKSTLIAGAITGAFVAMTKFNEAAIENAKIQKQLSILFKTNSEDSKELSINVKQIASNFDKEYNEIIIAANTVSKEFGISAKKSLELIREGFQKGSDINGEFLDQLKEYPAQMKAAGITANQFFEIINRSVTEGIYSDKGVDMIKEGGIQLRENTKSVQDALKYFDPSIKKEIELNAARGQTIKSMQIISNEFDKGKLNAKQMQEIVSTIFVGAGEDAGYRWLKLLKEINIESEKSTKLRTGTQKLIDSWTELTTRIADPNGILAKGLDFMKGATGDAIDFINQLFRDEKKVINESIKDIENKSIQAANDRKTKYLEKLKKIEEEYKNFIKSQTEAREKLGLQSEIDYYKKEITELKLAYDKRYITLSEYLKKESELKEKYGFTNLEALKLESKTAFIPTQKEEIIKPIIDTTQQIAPTTPKISDIFGLDTEEEEKLKETFIETKNFVLENINEINLANINRTNNAIEQSQKRIDILQNELNEEIDLKNQGYANDFEIKKKQIEDEKSKQLFLEAQKKKEIERSKKYEKAIATLNLATEISEIAKYSAKDPNNFWSAGVSGAITFALRSAIAIARYVTNIKSINAQQYESGTEYVDKENKYKNGIDTVPANLTKGERVLTVMQNKPILDIKNKDLPFFARLGKSYYLKSNDNKNEILKQQLIETKETNNILKKFKFDKSNKKIDLKGNIIVEI